MSLQVSLPELTEDELKVACRLHMLGGGSFGYGYCYYPYVSITGVGDDNIGDIGDRKHVAKIMKSLRDKQVVKFARGLMTEDGEVAGSGHAPNEAHEDELQRIVEAKGWE